MDQNTQTQTAQPMQAVCKTCGHTWTPRNANSTKNRKCSKCGSTEIETQPFAQLAEDCTTEAANTTSTQLPDDPTPEQLLSYINTKPQPKDTETDTAAEEDTENKLTADGNQGFKIHPALIAALIIIGIGAAGFIWFRRNRLHQNQAAPQQTKIQNEEQPEKITRPVIGFYQNGGA